MNQLNNPHMISDAQAKANSGKHYKTNWILRAEHDESQSVCL